MKDAILTNQNNAEELEKIYRTNKSRFKSEFNTLYPQLKGSALADFWNTRLSYQSREFSTGTRSEILFVIIAAFLSGLIAKLPDFLSIDQELFYSRNIGFIIFPFLSAYFVWKNTMTWGKIAFIGGVTMAGILYINFLPNVGESDVLILACIHILLVLWSLLGFAFVGQIGNKVKRRLEFLKYNGDLVVLTALILIAGGILTAITIGLFELIGISIQKIYFDYVVIFGLAAVPIVATYLTQTNPQLVGKVSPIIAKIFSPLVLIMLVIYLLAIVTTGKDPYNDRDFLLLFNALLIGVMAIIFFSIAGTSGNKENNSQLWILFLLSIVTIIVNGIALSAIIFRISEWGITPNRAAVLGANLLILLHLIMVTIQLFVRLSKKPEENGVENAIAVYLPVYFIWAAIVTFLFPLFFGFN